jgi:surface polysaccharide O-acyltransferase-like enzyme
MNQRISSIDFFKVPAILFIICIHTGPFHEFNDLFHRVLTVFIIQGARFAVPFFFMTSGYFFGKKMISGESPKEIFFRYSRKLLTIFVFWSLFYIIVPNTPNDLIQYGVLQSIFWKLSWISAHPITFIFQGSMPHLWFLMSLLLGLLSLTLFLHFKMESKLLVFTIFLYIFGVVAGAYASTPIGIKTSFNTRNGPFFSSLFVAVGWYLSSDKLKVTPLSAIIIATAGFSFQMTEAFILWNFFDTVVMTIDYSIGTVFFSSGIMLLLTNRKKYAQKNFFSDIGKRYTLGIYASHYLFLFYLEPLKIYFSGFLWESCFPFFIYISALVFTFLLAQNRLLRHVVSG